MRKLSLKAKVLAIMITLSVVGLAIFASFSLYVYKKDKIAFVYDYLANETQAKAALISATLETYDVLLGSIITRIDVNTNYLPPLTINHLQKNQKLLGVYFNLDEFQNLQKLILMESKDLADNKWSWNHLEEMPYGLNVVDTSKSIFAYKKAITGQKGFALIQFKDPDIGAMLKSNNDAKNFILDHQKILSDNKLGLEDRSINLIPGKINSTKSSFGLFEINDNKQKMIVSFSKINNSQLFAISILGENKIMLVQDVFLKQVFIFLTFIASIALLVGVLSARWLTWHIDQLAEGAKEIGEGNFNYKINITSKDEMGMLGQSFNSMGEKIFNLMEELKRYNTQLEQMVADRTAELKHLSDIQTAMLNSLGQGFIMIDKNNNILPIYSKISEDLFEVTPHKSTPKEIFAVSEDEANQFKELFTMTFNNMIGFSDMKALTPEQRSNSKNQIIKFDYAPIVNSESQSIDYVMLIGTDKTAEIESMEKFNREWAFSQMVTKIASNRFTLIKLLNESQDMLANCFSAMNGKDQYPLRKIQRLIHTLKGNFSYYHVTSVASLAHELETELEPHYNLTHILEELKFPVFNKLTAIKKAIQQFIDEYDNIIQYKDGNSSKNIAIQELEDFYRKLACHSPKLALEFKHQFFRTPIAPFFQMYPNLIHELGVKLDKQAKLELIGSEMSLPDRNWGDLFQQFVHFIRNSMDHGIESPIDRQISGKDEVATIKIEFMLDQERLHITLSDDGRGIDWKKIAAKDPSVKCEDDALERIKTGGISSKDEVSDISGRGVGVSSLFETVAQWQGTATFENNVGQGLRILISVPLYENIRMIKKVA